MPKTAREHSATPRSDILALLSVLFRPDIDKAGFLRALEILQPLLAGESSGLGLVKAAKSASKDWQLEREYHRLFLRPEPPVAHPFESVYLDGTVFGPTTISILREMREAGLVLNDNFRLPPDHLSVELELLAFLELQAEETARAGSHWESMQWSEKGRGLLEQHLARWTPKFLARLKTLAPDSPYTILAEATVDFLGLGRSESAEEKH